MDLSRIIKPAAKKKQLQRSKLQRSQLQRSQLQRRHQRRQPRGLQLKKPEAKKPAARFVVVSNCVRNRTFLRLNVIKRQNYDHLIKSQRPQRRYQMPRKHRRRQQRNQQLIINYIGCSPKFGFCFNYHHFMNF